MGLKTFLGKDLCPGGCEGCRAATAFEGYRLIQGSSPFQVSPEACWGPGGVLSILQADAAAGCLMLIYLLMASVPGAASFLIVSKSSQCVFEPLSQCPS